MTDVNSAQARQQLPDWTVVAGRVEISVRAQNFVQAIEFVNRFTDIAQAQDHHPDFDIRYNTIRLRVVSHDVGGLTDRDLQFAAALNVLIDEMQLVRQPAKISRTQLVIVSANVAAIKGFWQAVMNFKTAKHDADLLVDRSDILAPIRFQQLPTVPDASDEPNSRLGNIHLDVFVPAAQAPTRVQEAVAAGGKLLSDADAAVHWELADMDGNRVFLRTD